MFTNPKFLNLVEAVSIIAIRSPYGAVRGTEVCKNLNLPDRYLESEFQNLVHGGVLKSVRGPRGGYVLAKERRNISLAEIFRALEKTEKSRKPSRFASLVSAKLEQMGQGLNSISIHDILAEAHERGVIDAAPPKPDFAI